MQAVGKIVALDFASMPHVACWLQSSWYSVWGFKISLLPAILLVYMCWTQIAVWTRKKEVEKKLQRWLEDGVQVNGFGRKVARAYTGAHAYAQVGGYAFFFVYLLYPGICRTCFDMLSCRTFDSDTAVLDADYTLTCNNLGGDVPSSRLWYKIFGVLAVLALPVGIPAFFGIELYLHRDVIQQNPKCIQVAVYAPIFRFYEKDFYWAEIVFLYQRMILVGLMSLVEPGLWQGTISIIIAMVVIIFVAYAQPSKTKPYNKANVLSQMVIIITYFSALLVQSGRDGPCSAQEDESMGLTIALCCVHGVMMVILCAA